MRGWHQNRNRHPAVRLDHSGSFGNACLGRGCWRHGGWHIATLRPFLPTCCLAHRPASMNRLLILVVLMATSTTDSVAQCSTPCDIRSQLLGVRSLQLNSASESLAEFRAVAWSPIVASTSDASGARPMNRWNLGCRALLELAALGVMGTWGYENGTGAGRYVLMAGIPVMPERCGVSSRWRVIRAALGKRSCPHLA